ncbi:MAG: hypothetical protein HYV09_22235 [Deltaproteobacteria bacterium]|nr:hypothetical protein [Deltaproteobacteria bacterium]
MATEHDTEHEKPEGETTAGAAREPGTPVLTGTPASDDETAEPAIAEIDRVNVGVIAVITFAIVTVTVGVVIGVHQFFGELVRGEVAKKQLEWEDPRKRELVAVETAALSRYQYVSQKDGVVRVPLARARELVLAEYSKPYVPPPPKPEPAPAPEGSAAPAGSAAPDASASASASVAPSASAPPAASVAPSASSHGSAAPHH